MSKKKEMSVLEAARSVASQQLREVARVARSRRINGRNGHWPYVSDAGGVGPKGIKRARAIDKKHGVSVDYTPDGDPIFTCRTQRQKWCEAHGYYDRNAGYSDPKKTGRLDAELQEHREHEAREFVRGLEELGI